jgi:hypothetical protein
MISQTATSHIFPLPPATLTENTSQEQILVFLLLVWLLFSVLFYIFKTS